MKIRKMKSSRSHASPGKPMGKGISDTQKEFDEEVRGKRVHVPRTLNESYYLELNAEQLERLELDDRKIMGDVPAKSKRILLVPQLWLSRVGNVVITACPSARPSTSLLGHTLSQLRDIGPKGRQQLHGNELVKWILSECIHNIDRPCMAGLDEPNFYYLGKALAFTYDKYREYLGRKGGLRKTDTEEEQGLVDKTILIQRRLAMIERITCHNKRRFGRPTRNVLLREKKVLKDKRTSQDKTPQDGKTLSNRSQVVMIES